MREIKFRAWDNENQKYFKPVYEAYLGKLCDLSITLSGRVHMRTSSGTMDESMYPGRFVIEQFTGLKDKNGKDIFEGDIVNGWCDFGPGGEEQRVFPVVMTSFGCSIEPWNYKEDGYLPEIIGNIHQNQELLK